MRTKTPGRPARGAVLLALPAVVVLAACATGKNDMSGPVVGVPLDTPDHFMVAKSGIGSAAEPKAGEGCRNPMVDPRDKTLLELRRSANGLGDYRVSKYGLTSQELLRIDCATGKPIGIVAE